jgi:hypothetical protein
MSPIPKDLTGDKKAIQEFIDKFDVGEFSCLSRKWPPFLLPWTNLL